MTAGTPFELTGQSVVGIHGRALIFQQSAAKPHFRGSALPPAAADGG
jgi:hypothetical protein